MGDEWERGGGVTGRYWTEVSRRVAASGREYQATTTTPPQGAQAQRRARAPLSVRPNPSPPHGMRWAAHMHTKDTGRARSVRDS
eukprot:scaffold2172_cov130-Isochrysis_galbana.AAC.3